MFNLFLDKKFRKPRIWSNRELKKFSNLFYGDIVNVSAWKDEDKEGGKYKNYFINANSYSITNYKKEIRGFQGIEGEIFLNLEKDLPESLLNKFDVVFNHTTLEHIYNFKKAFKNICSMTRDVVILVVPFLQEMHGDYGDYWRFTPSAIKQMFRDNQMNIVYSSFNTDRKTSVYLFFIASKNPENWQKIKNNFSFKTRRRFFGKYKEDYVGSNSIRNNIFSKLYNFLYSKLKNKK